MTENEFPELHKLERIIKEGIPHLQARSMCEVTTDGRRFPVYALSLGNPSHEVPAVGFFGGIHSLERIGTQVLLAFLHSLLRRLRWDQRPKRLLASLEVPGVIVALFERNARCLARVVVGQHRIFGFAVHQHRSACVSGRRHFT